MRWKDDQPETHQRTHYEIISCASRDPSLPSASRVTAFAQQKTVFEDLPALVLSNDKVSLTVITEGGAMAQILLADDKEKINPIWNPYWIARQAGLSRPTSFFRGHFACLDGFGPSSAEERAAGLPFHGEASMLPWMLQSNQKTGRHAERGIFRGASARPGNVRPDLPHRRRREHRLGGQRGDQSAGVRPPRLLGRARDDQRALSRARQGCGRHARHKAKTKSVPAQANPPRQLRSFVDFTWPMAPTVDGQPFDIRSAPMKPNTTDHMTTLIDPSRRLGFATALHPEKRLLIGWVFRREEFPWVQTWLSNPGTNRMTRGLEFATQPFDLPRAEVLRNGPLFDSPVFRIFPAKSTITSSFLMFYTSVPEGFLKVDDVQLTGGKLVIEDRANRKTVSLAASRSL